LWNCSFHIRLEAKKKKHIIFFMRKKELLKQIIRDFHLQPVFDVKPRDVQVPLDTGKIITVIGARRCIAREDLIKEKKPDYVIVFPWNINVEIMMQLS
jgi:hypothetical protein